jgi:hypothetical protein
MRKMGKHFRMHQYALTLAFDSKTSDLVCSALVSSAGLTFYLRLKV